MDAKSEQEIISSLKKGDLVTLESGKIFIVTQLKSFIEKYYSHRQSCETTLRQDFIIGPEVPLVSNDIPRVIAEKINDEKWETNYIIKSVRPATVAELEWYCVEVSGPLDEFEVTDMTGTSNKPLQLPSGIDKKSSNVP